MQPQQQEHKIVVKKSSVEIDESEEIEIQNRKSKNILQQKLSNQQSKKQLKKDEETQTKNLLDLEPEMQQFNKQQYKLFLKDRVISIQGPQLITENVIKSYKLYKIKSRKKNSEQYDTCVSRRFSDFEYLQRKLIDEYGGCIIPLLPQKNIWANINMEGEFYIKERTKKLEKYLKSLLNHEILRMTPEIRNFLFFDQLKFSEGKGQFFSQIKTQDRVRSIASNAYSFGKGLISKYYYGKQQNQNEQLQILKPNLQDLKFMQYQRDVQGLVKVLKVLRSMVQNSLNQMRLIDELYQVEQQVPKFDKQKKDSRSKSKIDSKSSENSNTQSIKLQNQFQQLSQYILSCKDALNRRNSIRIEIDTFQLQLQNLQKKAKNNPRSQELDIVRNKLANATQRCEKWTDSLLQQFEKSVQMGKSMVQKFINSYTEEKQKFYGS